MKQLHVVHMYELQEIFVGVFQDEDVNRWAHKWCWGHVTKFRLQVISRSHPSTDNTKEVK